ncbi:MAG: methyltransferase domain-containing protein [Burkholderiales bacterium]|nr:methyltransferase domain-containing protein [Burkholderiales bacterium]
MLNWINKFIKRNRRCESGTLNITKISSYEEYMQYTSHHRQTHMANLAFEKSLIPDTYTKFTYNGYCNVCQVFVDFTVDFNYAYKVDNALVPNWRESLVCPVCHLNNRMRSVVHVFDLECHPNTDSTIYITEQTTALYKLFKQSFSNTYGSEYLGDSVSHGNSNKNGIRNEDLTQLSFSDDQFDFILSFDVLEHIPNYEKALAECYRCLKTGGMFLFSVPFVQTSEKNIVRARLSQTGEIVHLLPPEYHADPINSDGCLCFYHFGWEILENLKAVGFKNSQALLYWSNEFGYLGGEQLLLFARKE